MTDPMVQLIHLGRRFGTDDAVCDLSLEVPRGSTLGLLGMNGAGKSTTLRMLMGLLRPHSGEARIDGREVIKHGASLRRSIGYVPERPTVYGWMRVRDAMRFCQQLQPQWDSATAEELLRMFRLDRNKRVDSLSKGMATKLHLLLALAHRPSTLILDEPLSGLDPVVRDEFLEGVLTGVCQRDCTIILSSHQVDDVQRLADRVAILHEGRLLLEGDTQAILRDTRRLRLTLADSDVEVAPPRGTIRDRRDRRIREMTVRSCAEETMDAVRSVEGVVQVESTALSLEEVFKDVVLGAEANR
jgi:ABC-2 type transport system ATP-binding protein